jgi:hypothetical protein
VSEDLMRLRYFLRKHGAPKQKGEKKDGQSPTAAFLCLYIKELHPLSKKDVRMSV